MLLPQSAIVPLPTPVEGLYISSRNKITKGGLRQAQDRWRELNRMKLNKRIVLVGIFLFGLISPFIPSFTVFELFFLMIPLGLIFLGTLAYLINSFLSPRMDTRKAAFAFAFVPVFVLSQLFSGFAVDKIQRYRSQAILDEIAEVKKQMGAYPETHPISLGITYSKLTNDRGFQLNYSRGFMVTEIFDSELNKWESRGWND